MLKHAIERIQRHRPWCLRRQGREAAVLIPITDSEYHPELLLTVRASTLNTHRGEVCFPGGKRDTSDPDLQYTALRESQEELGIQPNDVALCGALGQVVSKHHLQVTPWVGLIPSLLPLQPNPDEIARVFKVPIRFFIEQGAPKMERLSIEGQIWELPYWDFEGEHIWGLTAYIICELLTVGFNLSMPMPHRPERGMDSAM